MLLGEASSTGLPGLAAPGELLAPIDMGANPAGVAPVAVVAIFRPKVAACTWAASQRTVEKVWAAARLSDSCGRLSLGASRRQAADLLASCCSRRLLLRVVLAPQQHRLAPLQAQAGQRFVEVRL